MSDATARSSHRRARCSVRRSLSAVRVLGEMVSLNKVGFELLSPVVSISHAIFDARANAFPRHEAARIGNMRERAVANAERLGVKMLTVHGHDLKTLRAVVSGRGSTSVQLLAVTVLTNLIVDDLREQGRRFRRRISVAGARIAYDRGSTAYRPGHEQRTSARDRTWFPYRNARHSSYGQLDDDQERIMTPDHAIAAGRPYRRRAADHAGGRSENCSGKFSRSHPRSSARCGSTSPIDERSLTKRGDHMPKGYVIAHAS